MRSAPYFHSLDQPEMAHRKIYDPNKAGRAAELRKEMTLAEVHLWTQALRARSMKGYTFHRQWPMFGYITDFFCKKLNLVIEVDGDVHGSTEQMERDLIREDVLRSKGMHILRLSNEEVLDHLPSSIEAIELMIEELEGTGVEG